MAFHPPQNTVVLDHLLQSGSPLSVQSLSCSIGLPIAEVQRQIQTLYDTGCRIESHPQHGLTLLSTGLGCWSDYIEPRHAAGLGCKLVVYQQTTSTQDVARQLAASKSDPHGIVVVADHQQGGRGRLGRKWYAPPGTALLMTLIVRCDRQSTDRLMLATCCAIAQGVEQLTGLSAQVRWPNDIVIEGRKLAGTLIEAVDGLALIGIGINVSVREHELPASDDGRPLRATSLLLHHTNVDRLRLLDALLTRLDRTLYHTDDQALHDHWRQHTSLLQQRVTVEHNGRRTTGRVIDLDVRHGLLLTDDHGGPHTFPAATTSLVLE